MTKKILEFPGSTRFLSKRSFGFWTEWLQEVEMGMDWYIEQIFTQLPFGVGVAIMIFLGILLIIWLLLPLWVLFIQWNTGKIRDEIRTLIDLLEKRQWDEKGESVSGPKD